MYALVYNVVSSTSTLLLVVDPGEGLVDDRAPSSIYSGGGGGGHPRAPPLPVKGILNTKVPKYNKRGW